LTSWWLTSAVKCGTQRSGDGDSLSMHQVERARNVENIEMNWLKRGYYATVRAPKKGSRIE
jgi:hypothetical protein